MSPFSSISKNIAVLGQQSAFFLLKENTHNQQKLSCRKIKAGNLEDFPHTSLQLLLWEQKENVNREAAKNVAFKHAFIGDWRKFKWVSAADDVVKKKLPTAEHEMNYFFKANWGLSELQNMHFICLKRKWMFPQSTRKWKMFQSWPQA